MRQTVNKNILITGGAGFIGSHVVRRFVKNYSNYNIFNLDVLTYAGNLDNLTDLASSPNYFHLHGNITDQEYITQIFEEYKVLEFAIFDHKENAMKTATTNSEWLGDQTKYQEFLILIEKPDSK